MSATPSWLPPAPRTATGARGVPPPRVRRLRRLLRRSRRPAAALLLAAATALVARAAVTGGEGGGPGSAAVVVAARDLPAGADLAGASTRTAHLPAAAVPRGALSPSDVTGAARPPVLAAPVRSGEVLTDVRLLDTGSLASLRPGQVALAVPVAAPLPDGLVSPGSRVAVLDGGSDGGFDGGSDGEVGGGSGGGTAGAGGVLVEGALVLAVHRGDAATGLLASGGGTTVVVLAVDSDDAPRTAAAASSGGVVLAVER